MQQQKRSLREILDERKAATKLAEQQTLLSMTESVLPPNSIVSLTPMPTVVVKPTIRQILEARKAGIATSQQTKLVKDTIQTKLFPTPRIDMVIVDDVVKDDDSVGKETFSLDIILNDKQLLARDMALAGKSFALTGAAGTGKTTALREIAKAVLKDPKIGTHDFRVQGSKERVIAHSIAFIAWTRIASGNIRRAVHKDPELEAELPVNITTAHNLLEYQPEFFWDPITEKDSMRFKPMRHAQNPLTLTHLIIEESTLIDLPMWERLYDALPENVQIIFVGDINQLPPVFGASIFNYALTTLPTVELTHVYRQAGDSLVLENAHHILNGEPLVEGKDFKIVRCGKTELGAEKLSQSLGITFPKWQDAGMYDPATDIILSPWNKHELGTDTINKWIAQRLGTERGAMVHHVIAGRTQHYLAIGDRVMYNKQVAHIMAIGKNSLYMGKQPKLASTTLDRFGCYSGVGKDSEAEFNTEGYDGLDLDKILEKDIDVTKQSSHHIDITTEDGAEIVLTQVGELSPSSFSLGYALTVHKAQGCEWKRVFFIMHKSHSINLNRELLYTAVTRAREECTIIGKEYLIDKTIANQRLKGNTLKDKIIYFNTGLLNRDDIRCTK